MITKSQVYEVMQKKNNEDKIHLIIHNKELYKIEKFIIMAASEGKGCERFHIITKNNINEYVDELNTNGFTTHLNKISDGYTLIVEWC